jgi:3-isopropylmalate/(R)-2-methylmalate dehydratase small subunit
MRPFTRVTAVAAPIDLPNVDTDRIIPARFLRRPKASAEPSLLFHDVRFDPEGHPREEFVLNQPPFREARILVTAENFGCGSSREWAVWALEAFGVRAVIGSSFGDIFHENCLKNGLLPVRLPAAVVADIRRQLHGHPGADLAVDLEAQTVTAPDGTVHRFEIEAFRKQALLAGQDEIAFTLTHEAAIADFEARRRTCATVARPLTPSCLRIGRSWGTVTTRCTPRPGESFREGGNAGTAPEVYNP